MMHVMRDRIFVLNKHGGTTQYGGEIAMAPACGEQDMVRYSQ